MFTFPQNLPKLRPPIYTLSVGYVLHRYFVLTFRSGFGWVWTNTRYVAAADLDGDEDIDVVSASYNDGRIVWFENIDGAGTFEGGEVIDDVLASAQSVVAVDLDNDGDTDLVACDRDEGRIVWYENTDGQANFSAAIHIALDVGVNEVSLPCQTIGGGGGGGQGVRYALENFWVTFSTQQGGPKSAETSSKSSL